VSHTLNLPRTRTNKRCSPLASTGLARQRGAQLQNSNCRADSSILQSWIRTQKVGTFPVLLVVSQSPLCRVGTLLTCYRPRLARHGARRNPLRKHGLAPEPPPTDITSVAFIFHKKSPIKTRQQKSSGIFIQQQGRTLRTLEVRPSPFNSQQSMGSFCRRNRRKKFRPFCSYCCASPISRSNDWSLLSKLRLIS